MIDLDRELRALDDIAAPDLGGDVGDRIPVRTGDVPSPFARPATTRVAVIATVTAICVVAGGLVWSAFTPGDDAPATTPTPAPAPSDPLASISEGWSNLPAPPTTAEVATTVWAGDRLILWGGIDPRKEPADDGRVLADGWSFDPRTSRWTPIAPAPISRYGATAAWTGSEVLVWGGSDEDGVRMDGAAFDPSTDTWTTIAEAPIAPRDPAVVIWNGTELFVWGGGDADAPYLDGAAYHPGFDSWRVLPDAPIGLNLADAAWTGRDLVILGSLLDRGNRATTQSARALAYDPTSNRWRLLPDPGLSPQASAVAAVGTFVYAFDYVHDAALLDARNDVWLRLADLPTETSECYVEAESTSPTAFEEAAVFGWSCGDAALFDVSDGVWRAIADRDDPMDYVTAEPTSAGDVVFVFGYGVTAYKGEVCFGCDGSPVVFRAYRPPSQFDDGAVEAARANARSAAVGFMSARLDGDAMFLTRLATEEALAEWSKPLSGLGPLTDTDDVGFSIRFVHGPLGYTGGFAVGVSIERASGPPVNETLFIAGPAPGPATELAIVGARPGLDGP